MWLWIWACVGRTFIPDIFFTPTTPQKKNTITQTRKHHHTTTTQTPPDRCHHKNTTTQHNTTNNTHTNTHIHRNTKTLKSVRSCLIPYVPAWQHVAITSQRPQKQVNNCSRRSIEKKSFHFTEGHSSRMPFFTCRSKQVCRARHGHLICRQNLQLIRKV